MNELRELLQGKLGWIETTRGQTHVSVKLSREDLATLVDLLAPTEMVGSNLPEIDPRTFGFRKPLTNCA